MKESKPNILLITCDQLRFDFVGAYGNKFINTPHMDRLAREGCVFERAYSPNPVCIPARHNLITGLTARHHGFDDNYFGESAKACPARLPTFAQILSDNCYETIAVGKMHFQPARRATGFDYFYNMDELPATREEDDYAMYLKEVGYGSLQSIHGVRSCLYMQPQRSLIPEKHHGSAWVADRSIEFLDKHRPDRPFLLWTGFIHPHPPLDIPDKWADLYCGKIPDPAVSKTPLSALAEENQQLGCMTSKAVQGRMRELYAAAISYVDYQIGRILNKLDETGEDENTLVVFTSDHGEMLGDLGTYQKFLPYDASCRIPMIMRYPKRLRAGTRDQRFVDLNDLLPTFLDVAGLDYPALYDLPGESVLVQDGVKKRSLQYVEHQRENKRWCSIRDESYKYVYYYGDEEQLFDMQKDPQETVNLLYECEDARILVIRDKLRLSLISYEKRYGLQGYIENDDFVSKPHYEVQPYYETNFPCFPQYLKASEAKQMNRYEDEILKAIEKEPTVKLSENHTREILCGWGGFSGEQVESLLKKAKEQGN